MRRKVLITALCTMLAAGTAAARDIYVSSETGQNDAAGTKEAPKKLLWRVMGELAPGDHVYVAEGRQEGQQKSGLMPKCSVSNVTIEGGWKKDFSERDPFRYLTIIEAPADQPGASGKVFHFEDATGVTLDGFCIDRGPTNIYYADGEPGANKRIEGHQDSTPWGFRAINKKQSGSDPGDPASRTRQLHRPEHADRECAVVGDLREVRGARDDDDREQPHPLLPGPRHRGDPRRRLGEADDRDPQQHGRLLGDARRDRRARALDRSEARHGEVRHREQRLRVFGRLRHRHEVPGEGRLGDPQEQPLLLQRAR